MEVWQKNLSLMESETVRREDFDYEWTWLRPGAWIRVFYAGATGICSWFT